MGLIQRIGNLARRSVSQPDLETVLETIEGLANRGRRIEALRYGCDHAMRIDDLALWARLGQLRMEAVPEAVAASHPRADWPPSLEDPFPDATSPPETDAASLNWRILGGAILHHGSLIVRNLFEPAAVARLRDEIDTALGTCIDFYADPPKAVASSAYLPFDLPLDAPLNHGRGWTQASGAVWAIESPRVFEMLAALYRSRGVLDAIAGYLGEKPVLSVGKTVLRRSEPNTGGDFHQDGAFMGTGIRTVNVWTALSDCGVDAPGLEVVGRRLSRIVETGTRGACFHWSAGREVAEETAKPASIVTPIFKAGDALIFDQLMLHSTYTTPAMTKRRYAIESWFFAPSFHAENQIPLVI